MISKSLAGIVVRPVRVLNTMRRFPCDNAVVPQECASYGQVS